MVFAIPRDIRGRGRKQLPSPAYPPAALAATAASVAVAARLLTEHESLGVSVGPVDTGVGPAHARSKPHDTSPVTVMLAAVAV